MHAFTYFILVCRRGFLLILGLALINPVHARLTPDADFSGFTGQQINDPHYQSGIQFIAGGQFARAAPELSIAIKRLEKAGNRRGEIQARLLLSRALEGLGEFIRSQAVLSQAQARAEQENNPQLNAMVAVALGNNLIAQGRDTEAEVLLRQATQTEAGAAINSLAHINLGNHYANIKNFRLSLAAYRQAIKLAQSTDQPQVQANAAANAARIVIHQGEYSQALRLLDQALSISQVLPDSHDKAFLLINLALSHSRLDRAGQGERHRLQAFRLLKSAEVLAKQIDDLVAMSYAVGYQGQLYEAENRYDDAEKLTRQAIFFAQQLGQYDSQLLLGLWHWQAGRAHEAKGLSLAALDAYQNAIQHLGTQRHAMENTYDRLSSGFESILNPLYQQYVELLFKTVNKTKTPERRNQLLRQVRDSLEDLKAAELRDYFQDSCVDELRAKARDISEVSSSALIVYPVILENRLELLLHLPSGDLINIAVDVSKDTLVNTVESWRTLLESPSNRHRGKKHGRLAGKLYQWLFEPYAEQMPSWQADTLVFVPEGVLRQVPMAALWDEQNRQYLIEKYPVAITPGVTLTDPRQINTRKSRPLYAGISEAIHDFEALPHVEAEITGSSAVFSGQTLLNNKFTDQQLEAELKSQRLNILHFATHGEFSGNANQSYILTYDGKLRINDLAQKISQFKFRDTPLDLLVLSACETARGDSRSALGLSGIAIKAGARSALGSLWKVDDEATSQLMQVFYENLKQPGISRAKALQQAQLALMKTKNRHGASYSYAAYWSPFILINSWL